MPTDWKMSGDDMICFPIHSYSPCAGTALKIYPISTGALRPVLEDGEKLQLSLQDQHLPGSSCCSGWALLSPTTLTGDCKGGTVQQVCLHRMSHCRVSTSSPVPRVFLCFPTCHIPPLPHELSVGSEQDPQWQPGAGQPQLPASSSCCSSASSQAGTSVEKVTAATLYLQHKLQSLLCLGCASAFCTVSHWY